MILLQDVVSYNGNFPGSYTKCPEAVVNPPRNVDYLEKSATTIINEYKQTEYAERTYSFDSISAVSAAYTQGEKQLLIDISSGSKNRFLHIVTNIPRHAGSGPNFALLEIKAGVTCSVHLTGGDVTDILYYHD